MSVWHCFGSRVIKVKRQQSLGAYKKRHFEELCISAVPVRINHALFSADGIASHISSKLLQEERIISN